MIRTFRITSHCAHTPKLRRSKDW